MRGVDGRGKQVVCSFEKEKAQRGRMKEAEIEREEDDDQDLDIGGKISGKLAACKVSGNEIGNLKGNNGERGRE